jgi:hypothetical protein
MIDWLLWGGGFFAGLSVGWSVWWFAPWLEARHRDRELEHRLAHRRPHPNGGTWPYDPRRFCDCGAYENDPLAFDGLEGRL